MSYKQDFPIFNNSEIVYLDSAATSQKPQIVLDAIDDYYKSYNANAHRGMYSWGIKASEEYENARAKTAQFINAKHSEEIIFTKNASEAFNLIAYSYGLDNVDKGDEIVISIMEHHSNLVPWQFVAKNRKANLEFLYIDENFTITKEEIENKITPNTKIVSITQMSNVLGVINDVKFIAEYAHKMGAIVIVDVAQSIPHMQVDVQELDADFVVFSGHKMLAPLGIGVLYGKKQLLEKMSPFLMGGDMIEYVYEQETTYAPIPNKFEAGTQNIEGVIGLGAAVDYINSIGYEAIQKIESEIVDYAVQELSKLDYVELYLSENSNHASVISFNITGVHPHDVSDILNSYNVCVRAGNHCAQPLLRFLKQDSTCRASMYMYNTKDDVDALVNGIKKVYDVFGKYIKKES